MNEKIKKKFDLYLLVSGKRLADLEREAVETGFCKIGAVGGVVRGKRKAGHHAVEALLKIVGDYFTREELRWEADPKLDTLTEKLKTWQS